MKAKMRWDVDAAEMKQICKELGATAPFPWDATVEMWPIILVPETVSRERIIKVLAKHRPEGKRFYLGEGGKWKQVRKEEMK